MYKQFLKILILLSLCIFFEKCAQVVPLSGGKKDNQPPKLILAIPANESNFFKSSKIVLQFNEYIKLSDLKNQLIISPKTENEPEISAEGKKIIIDLNKEVLKPNTTYKIYFGKSVVDMTEGNALENFEYVFTTGEHLDTLKIKGTLLEAFNEKPVADAIIGLYSEDHNKEDSLPYNNTPDYLSKTNSTGNYDFRHLPAKKFKIIAFTDKNKNYKYDGESEKIGFNNEELQLTSDTMSDLFLFQEEASKLFMKKNVLPYYGKAQIIYNKKSEFKIEPLWPSIGPYIYESDKNKEKDTINIYYRDINDSLGLIIKGKSNNADTIRMNLPKLRAGKLKSLSYLSNTKEGILNPGTDPEITFYNLIDTVKTDIRKMELRYSKDSVWFKEPVKARFIEPHRLMITNKLNEGTNYILKVDTACFIDVNGKYNDSLSLNFKIRPQTEFGKVTLKMLLNKKQSYIVQLMNDKEQIVKEEYISFSLSSSNSVNVVFTGVLPGTYTTKVVFDDDQNKKWNTGNYLTHKQAEKVFISSKQIKVVADWEVEEEIKVK